MLSSAREGIEMAVDAESRIPAISNWVDGLPQNADIWGGGAASWDLDAALLATLRAREPLG